jgi:hypothetical protein
MLDHLAPSTHAPLRCGTHISKNQPDVEVCAMSLSKLPASKAEFDAVRGTREFVIAKFLLLALGPPGFGKVPYNSKRSVGQKEEAGKPLYESTDDGRVRLFSFEKGKTNKDKGERVEADETSGFLEPGIVLTFFLREDFWDPPRIVALSAGDEVVQLGSVIAMQVSSSNVDAAGKGYLLKLKKLKLMPVGLDLLATLAKLPSSEDEYDSRMSRYRIDMPAMKGSLDSSSDMRCFAVKSMGPEACAFAQGDGFLISNARTNNGEGFRDDIFVPTSVVLRCFQLRDTKDALKLMNLALAVEAVGAILKSSTTNVLLSAEDVHPLVALTLLCDVNVLLGLEALSASDVRLFLQSAGTPGPFVARDLVVSKTEHQIGWHSTKQAYVTDVESAQLSFVLHDGEHSGEASAPQAHGQLSAGCSGAYKTLAVCLTRQGVSAKVLELEMRLPHAASMRQKRKRPVLEWFADEQTSSD